jgi:DNA-binding SARP family transcriptional activator
MNDERAIHLFGRVTARAGSHELEEFTTSHCRALLAFLAMHPDIDHPRERLVQALWPRQQDGSSRNRLNVTLYHLKKSLDTIDPAFGGLISSRRSFVRLDSAGVAIDLSEFRRHLASARLARSSVSKRKEYARAVELYRGPLTPEIVGEWTLARQIESSEMFQEASVWLAKHIDDSGEREKAQTLLSRSLDVEPFSERATELLTNWYVQSGKYEMAVSCAKRLRRALAVHGRAPSQAMLDRIDELNVILADRARAVVFADESVVSVVSTAGIDLETFEQAVRDQGGSMTADGRFGLFSNPLIALESARKCVHAAPVGRAYIYTTILGPSDPVPSVASAGLRAVSARGVYGSDCFACLASARGIELREDGGRNLRVWRVF